MNMYTHVSRNLKNTTNVDWKFNSILSKYEFIIFYPLNDIYTKPKSTKVNDNEMIFQISLSSTNSDLQWYLYKLHKITIFCSKPYKFQ